MGSKRKIRTRSGATMPGAWVGFRPKVWRCVACAAGLLLTSCGDSGEGSKPDTIPPGGVVDLAAADTAATSIDLIWTAPADDGSSGGAVASYDMRYGGAPSFAPWDSLREAEGEPAPAAPGTRQSMRIGGLEPDSLYLFVLRSVDDAALLSPASNMLVVRTRSDPFSPGAVADLRALAVRSDSVHLGWTAPAENGSSGGRVATYDLRFRLQSLDEGVWDRATPVDGEPAPSDPGRPDSIWIAGLEPAARYAFGIKSRDAGGLESGLSNVALVWTASLPDTITPAAVTDLHAEDVYSTTVRLQWTATGDDDLVGTAAGYELRYRAGGIDESLWEVAVPVEDLATPSAPGSLEQAEVYGLSPETSYAFALKVVDDEGNRSALSNVETVFTPAPIPLFIDPRGIAGDPSSRDIFVADHGDSTVYRLAQDGTKAPIARIPGVLQIARQDPLRSYATSTGSQSGTGALWRYGGSSSQPIRLGSLPLDPSDLAVEPSGNVVIAGVGGESRLLRFRSQTGLFEELLSIADGVPSGVAVDADGGILFGVNRPEDALIRRRAVDGGVEDLHLLGAGRTCGDLALDPDGRSIWYIDKLAAAVVRVSPEGFADTLASGLDDPTAIAPGPGPSVYYCNPRGFVRIQEIDPGREAAAGWRSR